MEMKGTKSTNAATEPRGTNHSKGNDGVQVQITAAHMYLLCFKKDTFMKEL